MNNKQKIDLENEEINKLKNDLKEMREENKELKKNLTEADKKMKEEIYKIKKMAWDDFVGEDFEVENGILGLNRDVYLSLVKFLNSSMLRKVSKYSCFV
jgi:seryl-tRNA synthetase